MFPCMVTVTVVAPENRFIGSVSPRNYHFLMSKTTRVRGYSIDRSLVTMSLDNDDTSHASLELLGC